MDINQNNYESFFLLYVDNELSAAERLCVEAFIQEHPLLAAELEIFKAMVLPAEETRMADKNMLYRSAAMEQNMQEAMLLKLDNELSAEGSKELMGKIGNDESIRVGWELLKKTKLDANDRISFPHKQSLYRREKPSAVVYGRFTRWAVAAALIAAGFFAGVAIVKNQYKGQTNMANVDGKKSSGKRMVTPKTDDTSVPVKQRNDLKEEVDFAANPSIPVEAPELAEVVSTKLKKNSGHPQTPGTVDIAEVTQSKTKKESQGMRSNNQQFLAADNEKLNMKSPERQDVSTVLASVPARPKQAVEIIDRDLTAVGSSYARSALMEEPQQNDNHILFMDEEEVARTKAGIFFKKLKRTVTRSTNIKTGNSIKIAGFEFAVK